VGFVVTCKAVNMCCYTLLSVSALKISLRYRLCSALVGNHINLVPCLATVCLLQQCVHSLPDSTVGPAQHEVAVVVAARTGCEM
jgi:hypothetical protein